MNEHKRVRLFNPINNKEKQAIKKYGDIWFVLNRHIGIAICMMTHDSVKESIHSGDIRW